MLHPRAAVARPALPARLQGQGGSTDADLCQALLRFIADCNLSANPAYLDVACALVRAAYAYGSLLVVDLFAGGGARPLEVFASDLNPVAYKGDAGGHPAPELAEALRQAARRSRRKQSKHWPPFTHRISIRAGRSPTSGGAQRAENCGAEFPLVRSSQKGEAQVGTDPSRGWRHPPAS